MDSLVSQVSTADTFTSGAWSLYFVGAFGLLILSWWLIRKLNNDIVKSLLMSLVLFLCFSLAKVEFDDGVLLWIPALPYLAVDIAFQGGKTLPDLIPYLALSALMSLVFCSLLAIVARKIKPKKSEKQASAQD
jgi:FtsH-binding integral membrane protein